MQLFVSNNHYLVSLCDYSRPIKKNLPKELIGQVSDIDYESYLLLIDTGSQKSFSFTKDLHVCFVDKDEVDEYNDAIDKGVIDLEKYEISEDDYEIIKEDKRYKFIKEHTDELTGGLDVDGLIGMDILKKRGLILNITSGEVWFSNESRDYSDDEILKDSYVELDMDLTDNKITIHDGINVNGHDLHNVIIDTGAYVSYINARFLREECKTNSSYYDYSPFLGELQGNYYKIDLKVQKDLVTEKEVGKLDNRLSSFDAFINPCLLSKERIFFDFTKKKIVYLFNPF